ncbi:hypothetical protein [Pseudomonas phage Rollin]|nr:hypothetical protein [Pseudomonas phage Rollin]
MSVTLLVEATHKGSMLWRRDWFDEHKKDIARLTTRSAVTHNGDEYIFLVLDESVLGMECAAFEFRNRLRVTLTEKQHNMRAQLSTRVRPK